MSDDRLERLGSGEAYRFADYATLTGVIAGSGVGVYTIWDEDDALVYVGVAGRNPAGKGLASRLRSHASGRRSGGRNRTAEHGAKAFDAVRESNARAIAEAKSDKAA
jgi:hypothetical protein